MNSIIRSRAATQLVRTRLVGLGRQHQVRNLNKNPYMEEWNGMREDTHKTFDITRKNFFALFVAVVAFPYLVLIGSRADEIDHDLHGTSAKNKRHAHQYI